MLETSFVRHFKNSPKLTLLVALLLGLALLSACGRSSAAKADSAENKTGAKPADLKPIEVTTAVAIAKEVPQFIQATGSFSADETSDVAPAVAGQVVETPVNVGAFVQHGQVLARLDDRDAKARLQQAIASEQQAEAALHQAEAKLGLDQGGHFDPNTIPEVRAAQQNYLAAESQAVLAEANERRYADLVKTGDVSQSVYDQAHTQAQTARAGANAAKLQYEVTLNQARQSNQGVAMTQAALENARAQVTLSRKAVTDMTILSPFSGYVSDRPVAKGMYVTTSSKIVTLLQTNPIKLKLQLPESEAGSIQPGQSVVTTVAAFAQQEFAGMVKVLNPAVDASSRTVTAEIYIDNPGNKLRPGMFATARIIKSQAGKGVFVPRTAVQTETNSTTARLYVVKDNIVRVRLVQLATLENQPDGLVRILSGIEGGESIVTNNLDQLFDGATVKAI